MHGSKGEYFAISIKIMSNSVVLKPLIVRNHDIKQNLLKIRGNAWAISAEHDRKDRYYRRRSRSYLKLLPGGDRLMSEFDMMERWEFIGR